MDFDETLSAGSPLITSIVLMSAEDEAAAPARVSDEDLEALGSRLAAVWERVTVSREPPAIWTWEPLVRSGIICLAGLSPSSSSR